VFPPLASCCTWARHTAGGGRGSAGWSSCRQGARPAARGARPAPGAVVRPPGAVVVPPGAVVVPPVSPPGSVVEPPVRSSSRRAQSSSRRVQSSSRRTPSSSAIHVPGRARGAAWTSRPCAGVRTSSGRIAALEQGNCPCKEQSHRAPHESLCRFPSLGSHRILHDVAVLAHPGGCAIFQTMKAVPCQKLMAQINPRVAPGRPSAAAPSHMSERGTAGSR